MPKLSTQIVKRTMAAAALLLMGVAGSQAADLQKVRIAETTATMGPIFTDMVVSEYLGYYKQDGLSVDSMALGSNAAAMAALNSQRVEFYLGVGAFQLPLIAKGQNVGINVFETTYPFKYGLAVNPDSPIKSIKDLSGKNAGVSNLGTSDYPVGKTVMKLGGADNVNWLAVGEGATGGHALQKGDIDALFYYDTGFATIQASGIPLRFLDIPSDVPKIGGVFLTTSPDILKNHRDWVIGVARGIAKANVFIRENPEAAAYIFDQMYPEAAPKGKSLQDQVKIIEAPILARMKLYASYDPSVTKWGFMKDSDWQDEINFAGLQGKIPALSAVYTNEIVDEANDFDAAKVKADADNFKIPYKQ